MSTQRQTDPGGGYLHLLPTYLPEGLHVTGVSAGIQPWLTPAHSGFIGTKTANGQAAMTVTFEEPTSWLRTAEPIEKFDREWLYLRRYSTDQALARGSHAFAEVRPGDDPPDAFVTTDGGVLGVESTALTLQDRRGAHALFRLLRQRLQGEEPVRFAQLAGHMIYVWFSTEDPALALPPRRSEEDAVDELISELAAYTPKTDHLFIEGGLPDQAPPLPLAKTTAGAIFYAVPLINAVPASMLFTIAGFEIGMAYTSLLTAQSAWTEMQRLIDDHDKPGVNLLIVSAGAPDQHGLIYLSEEALATFLMHNPIPRVKPPAHIERVVLHSWSSGWATYVYPDVSPLFGPLYGGLVPLHHPRPGISGPVRPTKASD